MQRLRRHAHAEDLQPSIAFHSRRFAAEPTRVEHDYAKWMLGEPRINFAVSTRGGKPGVDHRGLHTPDSADELAQSRACAQATHPALLDEGETT
jgi:hypothetical protein